MRSLGTYLRQLRESRGASLEDIARSTRVGKGHLEALEEGIFSELPAPVFVRGFLRSYCGFLGVPPDEALVRYHEDLGETAPVAAPGPRPTRQFGRPKRPVALSLVLLTILGLTLLAVAMGLRDSSAPPPPPAGAVAQPAPAPAPAGSRATPAPSPGVSTASPSAEPGAGRQPPAPPSVAVASGQQRLVVRALEPTWIRVQADSGQVTQELLPAGATREWTADQRFVLTVGNAGGIEVELNGRQIPRLGASGTVIQRLVLPPEQGAPRS